MDKDKQKQLAKAFLKNKIKLFLGIIAIAIVVIFITMLISPKFAARLVVTAISFLTIFLIASIVEFIIGLIKGFKDSNENPIKIDSASNHKYAKYIDENGEIPIFVMEKKYLITDWGNKILMPFLGLWFSLFFFSMPTSFNNTLSLICGYFFAIGCSLMFIESFLHDIFVRKIICYDDYFKVTNRFKEHKREYSQIKHFSYMRLGIFPEKILYFRVYGKQFTYIFKRLSDEQFRKKDIDYLVKLLRYKGVRERGLFGYID